MADWHHVGLALARQANVSASISDSTPLEESMISKAPLAPGHLQGLLTLTTQPFTVLLPLPRAVGMQEKNGVFHPQGNYYIVDAVES